MTRILILFLACFSLAAHAQVTQLDGVAAVVEDNIILKSEIEERIASALQQMQQQGRRQPGGAEMEQLREQVLEQLIMESIQYQLASRSGMRVDDNIINDVLNQTAQSNGMDFDTFRQLLESEGNYAAYRRLVGRQLVINEFEQRAVNSRIEITRQEVENYLRSEEGETSVRPEFHLANILIEAGPDEERRRELADLLYQRLSDGETVPGILAAGNQVLGIPISGSDLGWRRVDNLPSLFADVVPDMQQGDVSEPIRNESGYHLVQVLETRGGAALNVAQTHVRHILIAPNEIRTEAQAEALVNELYQRIQDGEDFGDIARQNTDDVATIVNGGDLDWVMPGQLPPEFAAEVEQLEVGEISRPFRGDLGWHIAEVLGRRDQDMTEENKRFRAEQVLRNRKFEMERQNWLTELRDTSYVQIIGEDDQG